MLTKARLVVAAAAAALLSSVLSSACSSGAQELDAGSKGGSGGPAGAGALGGAGGAGGAAPDGGSDAGGPTGGSNGDDALIFPEGLEVSLEPGGAGTLDLYALTLRDGPDGLELYAALTNDGDVLACDAALNVTLYDTTGQPIGTYINGLNTKSFYLYTLPDASTTIAACAKPGDVTMTQIVAPNITVADVGQVVYYYAYFALDAVLIDGLVITQVNAVTGNAGTTYMGTVVNTLDQTVSSPSVRIFPLNRVGRPLGVAKGGDSSQIPAAGTWTFQTDAVDMPGVDWAAFPAASFSN